MAYGFHVDTLRCVGCRTCEEACCAQCRVPAALSCRTVSSYQGGVWEESEDGSCALTLFAYFLSLSCLHCAFPPCTAACPCGALAKDGRTGLVRVAAADCTGCGACAAACPYDAVRMDPDRRLAVVCDGCAGDGGPGREPACTAACPEGALHFGDLAELRAAYGALASIPPLPAADQTQPALVLTAPPALLRALR